MEAFLFYRRKAFCVKEDGHDVYSRDTELFTLVIVHIVHNCNKQNLWAAAMIIGAIVAPARLLVPLATKLCIVSDNARTCQNDIIPVWRLSSVEHTDLSWTVSSIQR